MSVSVWIKRRDTWVLFGLAIVSLVFVLTQIFLAGPYYLQSDSASMVLLGREQLQSGQFFPSNWWYAQEIMVVSYNLFIIPFTAMFSDVLVARQAGIALICILLLFVMYFLGKKVFCSKKSFYIAIIFIFQLWGTPWAFMLFYQGSYILTLTYTLLTPLFFLLAFGDNLVRKSTKWTILFGFFIILMAFSGVRLLESTGISLLIALVLFCFMDYPRVTPLSKTRFVINIFKCAGLIIVACAIGYVAYIMLSTSDTVHFLPLGVATPYGMLQELAANFFHIPALIAFILSLIGYVPDVSFFSVDGVLNLLRVALMVGLVFVIPIRFGREYQALPFKNKLFFSFVIAYTIINTFVLVFSNGLLENSADSSELLIEASRYVLINLALIFILDADYLARHWPKDIIEKSIEIAVLALILCISLKVGTFSSLERGGIQQGLSMDDIAFLNEEDCTFGFATFWYSESTTILSNYEVEIAPVNVAPDLPERVIPFLMLASDRWFEPSYHEGSSFLLLRDNEYMLVGDTALETQFGQPEKMYDRDGYVVFVFDHNIAAQL